MQSIDLMETYAYGASKDLASGNEVIKVELSPSQKIMLFA